MLSLFLFLQIIGAENSEELHHFMKDIWSPYCKGISLLECPSGKAEALRDEIRAAYDQGLSIDEIRQELRTRYGDQLRMEPHSNWRGRLAYLIPWLAFLLVASLVGIFWHRRSKTKSPIKMNKPPKIASAEEEKILNEIESRLR